MTAHASGIRVPRKAVAAALSVTALVLLLLYLQGTIGRHKVGPGTVPLRAAADAGGTARVEEREVEDFVAWPGTVRSRTVANVAPKVMAHVLEVRARVGARVHAGDTLAVLDDRDIRARAQQARAALTAARARATQAAADLRRVRGLFQKQAATAQDLDAATARATAANAEASEAENALAEVQVRLGETTVRAPFDGVVSERLVDPGDMAVPGKPIVVIQDAHALRLEVPVAEHCAGQLHTGAAVPVRFDALGREVTATIEEIAPMADPQSRTVLIKAALPVQPDLYPGLFGSLRAACTTHAALLVPATAVRRVGQLETVQVLSDGTARLRDVRTGMRFGDRLEVLSGLRPGEQVVLPAATAAPPRP